MYICISWYNKSCWFLVKKMLIMAELKGSVTWFIYLFSFKEGLFSTRLMYLSDLDPNQFTWFYFSIKIFSWFLSLTLSLRRPLSYRNQSKSMDWLYMITGYMISLRHKRVKSLFVNGLLLIRNILDLISACLFKIFLKSSSNLLYVLPLQFYIVS